MIEAIRAGGIVSLGGIAAELNRRGVPTPRGIGAWQAVQVQRVLDRAGWGKKGISRRPDDGQARPRL